MHMREWAEGSTIQSTKSQHRHTLSYRLNKVFQRIARDHSWSWLRRPFSLSTVPIVVSGLEWGGLEGKTIITPTVTPGDIDRSYTGAEIFISGENFAGDPVKFHTYVRRVGSQAGAALDKDEIHLGHPLPDTFNVGTITVFRREYLPRSPMPENFIAENLEGLLRIQDFEREDNQRRVVIPIDRIQLQTDIGIGVLADTDTGNPQFHTTDMTRTIPTPRYAPVVKAEEPTGVVVVGKFYLSVVYYDEQAGIYGNPGPVLEYVNRTSAELTIEYGSTLKTFEESYKPVLLITDVNPKSLSDAVIKDAARLTPKMTPFYVFPDDYSDAPLHWKNVTFDNVLLYDRFFPTSNANVIRFREIPRKKLNYTVEGRLRMPWFASEFDEPPIPDDFAELVDLALSLDSTMATESNNQTRSVQYAILIRTLKGTDNRRSQSQAEDMRYKTRMANITEFDRYGLRDN